MIKIFEDADKIINGARQDEYGGPERNMGAIGEVWTAILRHAGVLSPDAEITPELVCILMASMKLTRLAKTPDHQDSRVDTCGYIGLMEIIDNTNDISATLSKVKEWSRPLLKESLTIPGMEI